MHKWLLWLPVWGSLFITQLPFHHPPSLIPLPHSIYLTPLPPQDCSPTRSFKGGFYSAEQFKRKWLLFPGLVCTSVRRWLFRRKWGPRYAGFQHYSIRKPSCVGDSWLCSSHCTSFWIQMFRYVQKVILFGFSYEWMILHDKLYSECCSRNDLHWRVCFNQVSWNLTSCV